MQSVRFWQGREIYAGTISGAQSNRIPETLLERLLESGIHGCTVLDSMGMMRVIDKSGDDLPMFGALRQLFDPARESSKTLMMVLAEDEVHKAKLVVRQVVGGLDHPDTGIMFAVPALFVEGLGANQQ